MWILLQKRQCSFLSMWIKAQLYFCSSRYLLKCLCSVGLGHPCRAALQVAVCLSVRQYQPCNHAAEGLLDLLQMPPHRKKRLPHQLCFQSEQQLIVTLRSKGRVVGMWRMLHLRLQLNAYFQSSYRLVVPSGMSALLNKQWTCARSAHFCSLSSYSCRGAERRRRRRKKAIGISCSFPSSIRQLMSSALPQVML